MATKKTSRLIGAQKELQQSLEQKSDEELQGLYDIIPYFKNDPFYDQAHLIPTSVYVSTLISVMKKRKLALPL